MRHYDCCVIGTGPGGQKAAIPAAKLGKRVCIIEKNSVVGGASINTGTIPSKALREAVLHLTGADKRGLFGQCVPVKRNITITDLIWGTARFDEETILFVDRPDDFEALSADCFIIATGSRPAKPATVPFDDKTIFTSDELLSLR